MPGDRQLRLVDPRPRAARPPGPRGRHARRARTRRGSERAEAPPLVADLHVHYPMHVLSGDRDVTLGRMVRVRRREGAGNKARGAILWVASRLLNYRSWDAGPRVTADFLAAGGVRVGLSVLYSPFDEMDLDEPYGALPEPGYFGAPARAARAGRGGDRRARRARPWSTTRPSSTAPSPTASSGSSTASRAASTSAPRRPTSTRTSPRSPRAASPTSRSPTCSGAASPPTRRRSRSCPTRLYNTLFPQKAGAGLTELGEAAVRAMYREGMLIDVSHMRGDALEETFELLDPLDPESGAAPAAHPSSPRTRATASASRSTTSTTRRCAASPPAAA